MNIAVIDVEGYVISFYRLYNDVEKLRHKFQDFQDYNFRKYFGILPIT